MAISRKILGKRLKTARGKKHTQENVAEAIGLSVQQVSRIECGNKPIYVEKLSAWCDYLEVPIAEVVGGADMANGGSQRFREITRGCSPETVEALLDICERVVQSIDREAHGRREG